MSIPSPPPPKKKRICYRGMLVVEAVNRSCFPVVAVRDHIAVAQSLTNSTLSMQI